MTKTYLITGASDGIGLATARLAAQSGAAVLMVARDAARLQAAADALPGDIRPEIAAVDLADAPAVRTSFSDAGKADLRSTLVLKLFPTVGPLTVARAVISAVQHKRQSMVVGPVAAIVMGTAPIMPRGLDLAFMTLLFKGKRSAA